MAKSNQSIQSKVEESNIFAVEPKAKAKGKVSTTVEGVELKAILGKHYSTNDKGDKHSLQDAIDKIPSLVTRMHRNAKSILEAHLEIGNVIIRLEAEGVKPESVRQIKAVNRKVRYNCKFVASHWEEIQKLISDKGTKSVWQYSVESLRKMLKASQKAEAEAESSNDDTTVGTSDTSNPTDSSEKADASGDDVHEVKTPVDLANDVVSICQIKGWSLDHVVALIQKAK